LARIGIFQPNLRYREKAIAYLSRIPAISRENLSHQGERRVWSKIGVKQIQDGGRPPSWKDINRCISGITDPFAPN